LPEYGESSTRIDSLGGKSDSLAFNGAKQTGRVIAFDEGVFSMHRMATQKSRPSIGSDTSFRAAARPNALGLAEIECAQPYGIPDSLFLIYQPCIFQDFG